MMVWIGLFCVEVRDGEAMIVWIGLFCVEVREGEVARVRS